MGIESPTKGRVQRSVRGIRSLGRVMNSIRELSQKPILGTRRSNRTHRAPKPPRGREKRGTDRDTNSRLKQGQKLRETPLWPRLGIKKGAKQKPPTRTQKSTQKKRQRSKTPSERGKGRPKKAEGKSSRGYGPFHFPQYQEDANWWDGY